MVERSDTMAKIEHFRYWCQKVLPLVYDDSLSYYELLGKVIKFLNDVVDAVNENTDDVASMRSELTEFESAIHTEIGDFKTYINGKVEELETYMNNYFNNLDVQNEINAKLDAMAQDGTLTALITPLVPDIVGTWLSEHITPTTPAIDNTLTVSGAGADSKTVGDAISDINNNIEKANNALINGQSRLLANWVRGYSNVRTGVVQTSFDYRITHANWLSFPFDVILGINYGYTYNVFDNEYNLITSSTDSNTRITAGTLFRVNITKRNEDTSVPADIETFSNQLFIYNELVNYPKMMPTTLEAGTDLNNVSTLGEYALSSSSEYTHCPISSGNHRLLTVYRRFPSTAISQKVENYIDNMSYTRQYTEANGWTEWQKVTIDGNLFVADSTVADGTDLDNLKTTGVYLLAAGNDYDNLPLVQPSGNVLFVYKRTPASALYQKIENLLMNARYIRNYTQANGWSVWLSDSYETFGLDTHTHTIAHRGVPQYTPGGTKPSYILAKNMGLQIAEGDVRFTSDNVPVIFHDATYTVDGVTHTIANETLAQFKEYDIGGAYSSKFTGTYGLTLEEFLDLCNDLSLTPTIEFKTGTAEQVESCLDLIDSKRCKVFNYKASVANLKVIIDHDNYASVRLGADEYSTTLYNNLVEILNYGNKKHQTHCIFSYGYGAWTSEQIQTCREAGAIMGVTSINSLTQLRGMTEDVDIIFTEYGFNATKYIIADCASDW